LIEKLLELAPLGLASREVGRLVSGARAKRIDKGWVRRIHICLVL
jgi:hypothetical protein